MIKEEIVKRFQELWKEGRELQKTIREAQLEQDQEFLNKVKPHKEELMSVIKFYEDFFEQWKKDI